MNILQIGIVGNFGKKRVGVGEMFICSSKLALGTTNNIADFNEVSTSDKIEKYSPKTN